MNVQERIALHRRIASGCQQAWRNGTENRRLEFPDELVIAEDAIFVCPGISNGADFLLGKVATESGMSISEMGTAEFRAYWKFIPDFALKGDATHIADENGFVMSHRYEGTTTDGRTLGFWEVDLVTTDEQGAVRRWELFLDPQEYGEVLGLVTGKKGPLTWEDWSEGVARALAED